MKSIRLKSNTELYTTDPFMLVTHLFFNQDIGKGTYHIGIYYNTPTSLNYRFEKIMSISFNSDYFSKNMWINLFHAKAVEQNPQECFIFCYHPIFLEYRSSIKYLLDRMFKEKEKEKVITRDKKTEKILVQHTDWLLLQNKFNCKILVTDIDVTEQNISSFSKDKSQIANVQLLLAKSFSEKESFIGEIFIDSPNWYLTEDFCTRTIFTDKYINSKCPKDESQCLMWRRKDNTGLDCKTFLEKNNPSLINSTIVSFCNEFNSNTECDCFNRYNRKDYIYNKPNKSDHDYCWYTGCLSDNLIIDEHHTCNIRNSCTTNYTFKNVDGEIRVVNNSCNNNLQSNRFLYPIKYYLLFCVIIIFSLKLLKVV